MCGLLIFYFAILSLSSIQRNKLPSFSIVLWEIGMCKKPFEEIEADINIVGYVLKSFRPKPIPTDAPLEYIEIMKQSWSLDSSSHPTIEVVQEKLHKS